MIGPYICKIFAEAEIDLLKLNLLCKGMHQTYENNKDEYLKNLNLRDKHTLFLYACEFNKLNYVELLLPYVNPSICQNKAFRNALYSENLELAKLLLKSDKLKLENEVIKEASGDILKLLIEINYLDEKNWYKIIINNCMYSRNIDTKGDFKILVDSLSYEYKVLLFNEMIKKYKYDVINYMITSYNIDFDISYLNYQVIRGLVQRGYDSSFIFIFSNIPLNMHDTVIKYVIDNFYFNFMFNNNGGIEGSAKILAYVLKYGSFLNDVNEYLYNVLTQYMNDQVDFIIFIKDFLLSNRLKYISRKVLKLAAKSSREIVDLIFNSGKINYTDIDEVIIDLLIECDHQNIAMNLINHEQVNIEKNYDQDIRKRKAVDEMTDKYIRSMELDIKVRLEKKRKC